MQKNLLASLMTMTLILTISGCSTSRPKAIAEPDGPKRPINAIQTDERAQLRFVDPDDPEKLKAR